MEYKYSIYIRILTNIVVIILKIDLISIDNNNNIHNRIYI